MYTKCGRLALGSKVFHEMSRRDIVSWSTLIAGKDGPKPNEFALASVLSVCGSMSMLEQRKQLHAHVLSIDLEFTSMVQSAFVNMYLKCGSIKEAAKIFHVTKLSDIISWTTMINGYAECGFYQEAIDLFEKIPRYNSMSNDFGINLAKEHYGCMVDLLCRAGRLSKAEDMIKSMLFQHDDVVWSTLLRACGLHGDVDCGKCAADEILKLDPSFAKGKWREAEEVRKMMRSKGVIKEPGWSWIKVKD
ncbi:hypothetical protein ACFX1Z_018467 [Malus domestica]